MKIFSCDVMMKHVNGAVMRSCESHAFIAPDCILRYIQLVLFNSQCVMYQRCDIVQHYVHCLLDLADSLRSFKWLIMKDETYDYV